MPGWNSARHFGWVRFLLSRTASSTGTPHVLSCGIVNQFLALVGIDVGRLTWSDRTPSLQLANCMLFMVRMSFELLSYTAAWPMLWGAIAFVLAAGLLAQRHRRRAAVLSPTRWFCEMTVLAAGPLWMLVWGTSGLRMEVTRRVQGVPWRWPHSRFGGRQGCLLRRPWP